MCVMELLLMGRGRESPLLSALIFICSISTVERLTYVIMIPLFGLSPPISPGVLGPTAKMINKLAEVSGSCSALVQISVIVIPREAAWAQVKKGRRRVSLF